MTTRARPGVFCEVCVPTDAAERVDEASLRSCLRRIEQAGVGLYVGAMGPLDMPLSVDEATRAFRIAAEECNGASSVFARLSAGATESTVELATRAMDAGLSGVELAPLVHHLGVLDGLNPDPVEQETQVRRQLERITHPVALTIRVVHPLVTTMHSAIDFIAPVELAVKLSREYSQVELINLHTFTLTHLARLQDMVPPTVKIYVGLPMVLGALPMGAAGCQMVEANVVPDLCRSIVDSFDSGDIGTARNSFRRVERIWQAVRTAFGADEPGPRRMVEMALAALGTSDGGATAEIDSAILNRARSNLEAVLHE